MGAARAPEITQIPAITSLAHNLEGLALQETRKKQSENVNCIRQRSGFAEQRGTVLDIYIFIKIISYFFFFRCRLFNDAWPCHNLGD
jgi:hypothetical protein